MEGNDEVFRKVMADESLRPMVSDRLLRRIYERARQSPQGEQASHGTS